jgi:hypothetical protein
MYLVSRRSLYLEFAGERGVRISEPYQLDLLLHQRTPECRFNLGGLVIMAVDVASHTGAGEESHIVNSSEKADIIDLRNSRRE